MDVIPDSDPLEEPQAYPASSLSASDFVFDGKSRRDNVESEELPVDSPPSLQDTEPHFASRSLRQRAPQQLKPYSVEAAKYVITLNRKDWQDAVVMLKDRPELDTKERKAKKRALLERGADDLEGWLELEDGMQVRREEAIYLAQQVEKVQKKRKLTAHEERDRALRRALTGRSDSEPMSQGRTACFICCMQTHSMAR